MQVKLFYDAASYQLVVTIMCAVDLSPRDNGQPCNPYCKLYMLPDRRSVPFCYFVFLGTTPVVDVNNTFFIFCKLF